MAMTAPRAKPAVCPAAVSCEQRGHLSAGAGGEASLCVHTAHLGGQRAEPDAPYTQHEDAAREEVALVGVPRTDADRLRGDVRPAPEEHRKDFEAAEL